ncbi:hypothetical protein ACFC18_29000 [Streptomyces sp. NPDC056121]
MHGNQFAVLSGDAGASLGKSTLQVEVTAATARLVAAARVFADRRS